MEKKKWMIRKLLITRESKTTDLLRESGSQAFKDTQIAFVERKQERPNPLERGAGETLQNLVLQELAKVVNCIAKKRGKSQVMSTLNTRFEIQVHRHIRQTCQIE